MWSVTMNCLMGSPADRPHIVASIFMAQMQDGICKMVPEHANSLHALPREGSTIIQYNHSTLLNLLSTHKYIPISKCSNILPFTLPIVLEFESFGFM